LLVVLKKIETQGLLETARRAKQRCGQVFRHGIGLGYCSRDITVDLRGLLEGPVVEHHASITEPREVGGLLRAIESYTGKELTRYASLLEPPNRAVEEETLFVLPRDMFRTRLALQRAPQKRLEDAQLVIVRPIK
jgi:hypothetical protein